MASPSVFNPSDLIGMLYPSLIRSDLPQNCVLSLFPNTRRFIQDDTVRKSPFIHNRTLYLIGEPPGFSIAEAGLGAPAAVMTLEILIALGCRRFIIIGLCGILSDFIHSGDIILPTRFLSEEGTSSHYVKDTHTIIQDTSLCTRLETELSDLKLKCHQGLHWTTDAPFRETEDKISIKQKMGCLSVDMETSALLSCALFHQVKSAAILTAADSVARHQWIPPDHRKVSANMALLIDKIPELFQCL